MSKARIVIEVLSALTDEKKRKRLIAVIAGLLAAFMLPILIIAFILTSPIMALKAFFSGNELPHAEEISAMSPQINEDGDFTGVSYLDNPPIVYYSQNDPRWKDQPYASGDKNGTIGITGCGPASAAMAVSALTGYEVLPSEAAAWCIANNYITEDSGTYPGFSAAFAAEHGLLSFVIPHDDREGLINALNDGRLVIVLMGAGTFTDTSHYIVLRGMAGSGNVYVADPNSVSKSNKTVSVDTILNECKSNFTAVYPPPPPPPPEPEPDEEEESETETEPAIPPRPRPGRPPTDAFPF